MFGKNACKPGGLAKPVEISRVHLNYCEVGEDGKFPAMRMGPARGKVGEEDVLYSVPNLADRLQVWFCWWWVRLAPRKKAPIRFSSSRGAS